MRRCAARKSPGSKTPSSCSFLQIQGSGRVDARRGRNHALGYADHNGHPYRSIGRVLVERGELPLERASMQGIKAWARDNPAKLAELLNHNASYVFFRELPGTAASARVRAAPPGALGVPLTPRRSIAVDARYVPLGAPVHLATTWPNTHQAAAAPDAGAGYRWRNPRRGARRFLLGHR